MATLPLGKLTILLGAGILGSVLAKEGRIPSVSDVISGAFKVLKPISKSDSTSSAAKPRNEALLAQVNNLRQELKLLAPNSPVTILTSSTAGGRRYGVIIVVIVIGSGYMWWKGWKLPDFMFATKRGLSDACNSVAQQLEQVYSSITATKKELSSKLDQSSRKWDEIIELTENTDHEVTEVREVVSKIDDDIRSVANQIHYLGTKMGELDKKQDDTKDGVGRLLLCALNAQKKFTDQIQDSPSNASRRALSRPQITASSRTVSLPPVSSQELPSPSASTASSVAEPLSPGLLSENTPAPNGSNQVQRHLRCAVSATGSKDVEGTLGIAVTVASPRVPNGTHVSENSERSPSPELPQSQPTPRSGGFLSRTLSATQYFKFK